MATVTGLTKERMLEIEAASVVSGQVVGDNLVLIRHDGTEIVAGDVRGPAGAGGGGGTFEYTRTFASALTVWDFPHGAGTKALFVHTEDLNGDDLEGEISYPDVNTVRVTFYHPQTGFGRVFN